MYVDVENWTEIEKEIPIKEVAERLGIALKKVGSITFIPCPNPEHVERRGKNCQLYEHSYRCHCCHTWGGPARLVMSTGMSFREAVLWLNKEFLLGVDFENENAEFKPVPVEKEALLELVEHSGDLCRFYRTNEDLFWLVVKNQMEYRKEKAETALQCLSRDSENFSTYKKLLNIKDDRELVNVRNYLNSFLRGKLWKTEN